MPRDDFVDQVARRLLELSGGQTSTIPEPQLRSRTDIQRELQQKLGPEYIASRTGGGNSKVAYLEGHQAIALANEIFGYDGWSTEIRERKIEHPVDKAGRLCCSVLLRVTLPNGAFREDVGYGTVMKGTNIVQDLEKAGKEACTDALKRVLRQFGEPFGNCLYDKEFIKQIRHVPRRNFDIDIDDLRRPPIKRKRPEIDAEEVATAPKQTPSAALQASAHTKTSPKKNASKPVSKPGPSRQAPKPMAAPQRIPETSRPGPGAHNNHSKGGPVPVAESTPKEISGPPAGFVLSSSPPDLPGPVVGPDSDAELDLAAPAPAEAPAPPLKPETPCLVTGIAIEKFDQTNEWTDASFDASISLGPGCVLDQSRSEPVIKKT